MNRLRLHRAAHPAGSHPVTVTVPLPSVKKWIAKDTNGVNQVSVDTCSLPKEAHYEKLP